MTTTSSLSSSHPRKLQRLGLLTSGGDAPGMNAAIRAVVRCCANFQIETRGFLHGYQGLASGTYRDLGARDVANILQRGGTILKTARFPEMLQPETRNQIAKRIKDLGVDALIVIGGDGTLTGAHLLWAEHQIPYMALPGTIDNDLWGTEWTIGYDTAMNTAVSAMDKIRDTADSHDRLFVIEVMGRMSGALAASVGLACGAEIIFTPEGNFTLNEAVTTIQDSIKKGKKSSLVITTEGQKPGRAYDLADALRKRLGIEAKVCVLGHIQRGGSPSAFDRILASNMAAFAVDSLLAGHTDSLVGATGDKMILLPAIDILSRRKVDPVNLVQLAHRLSR